VTTAPQRQGYVCRSGTLGAGLPDDIHIFKPKIPLPVFLEGFGTENVGIFYDHFDHIM
jgi:hypothetical protein